MSTKLLPGSETKISMERGFIRWLNPHQSQTFELNEFSVIGRNDQCQICMDDPFLSQRHARIFKREKKYFIQDLRSRNGCLVNGTRVVEAELKDRDRITLGQQELIFSIQYEDREAQLALNSKNEKWQQKLRKIPAIAESDFPVLVTAPSGAGKEVIAQMIHRYSKRHFGPFVSVNCSALSENLIESELFGHVKGSFTGAENNRKGAFESARNGTLFLDEIGDLPISLQPKLLRALENNEIKPVGSDQSIKTDVRIIAATHNTLKLKVSQNKFREDLFYRLNVVNLSPPALKNRMEDFESLLYHFAKNYRVSFSFLAINALKEYEWPGNIRELKNFVARASAIYGRETVQEEDLDTLLDRTYIQHNTVENLVQGQMSLKEIEKEVICQALIKNRGNQRKSAEQLGLPKSTLHDRIKTYNINIEQLLET